METATTTKKRMRKVPEPEVETAKPAEAAKPAQAEKPAQPAKRDAFADAFSVTPAPAKSASKSSKVSAIIDKGLRVEFQMMNACKVITKEIEVKGAIAERRSRKRFIRNWTTQFVRTGQPPKSVEYTDGSGNKIDFIPTSRIYVREDTISALQLLGVDTSQYIELGGAELDFNALEAHGLLDALKEALVNLPGMTPQILAQVMKKKVKAKPELYQNMAKIARDSLPANASDDQVIERMEQIVDAVKPVTQLKNPVSEFELGEAIEFIASTDLQATPEEEAEAKKKKGFGSDE